MKIFSSYPEYFGVFRSCNVGKKKNEWCGSCSKCLFVALLLSAFLPPDQVIGIFTKDLLSDEKLIGILEQLTDDTKMKAFECVGTKQETLVSLYLAWKRRQHETPMPALIAHLRDFFTTHQDELEMQAKELLSSLAQETHVPVLFQKVIPHEFT